MEYILNTGNPRKYLIFANEHLRHTIDNTGIQDIRSTARPSKGDHLVRLDPNKMNEALKALRDYIEDNLEEFRLDGQH